MSIKTHFSIKANAGVLQDWGCTSIWTGLCIIPFKHKSLAEFKIHKGAKK